MKVYKAPEVEIVLINSQDILTSSLGTETPVMGDPDGEWEMSQALD